MPSDPVTDDYSNTQFSSSSSSELLLFAYTLRHWKSLHLFTIRVDLQPSLAGRCEDPRSVRLVRDHAKSMVSKGILDRADTRSLKVRRVCTRGNGTSSWRKSMKGYFMSTDHERRRLALGVMKVGTAWMSIKMLTERNCV